MLSSKIELTATDAAMTLDPQQLTNSQGPLLTQSQVRSLHVEWNRMELALDDKIRESLNEARRLRIALLQCAADLRVPGAGTSLDGNR